MIIEMTNRSDQFYLSMGPLLSRREIVKEVGGPIWDDDSKRWFLYMNSHGTVIGFAAMIATEKVVHMCSSWVRPGHRRQGIGASLVRRRIEQSQKLFPGVAMSAVCTAKSVGNYRRAGFRCAKQTKNFVTMEK